MSPKQVRSPHRPTARAVRLAVRLIVPVVFAAGLYHLFTHVVRLGYVVSSSMEPTLQVGDYYLLRLDAYRHRAPRRGEIIVFAGQDGEPYIKRVIGLPGEDVAIREGVVYIDGRPLPEPYLKERPQPEWPLRGQVPPNRYVVLGDNRNYSFDSRDSGYVPREAIVGQATAVIWPRAHARSLLPEAKAQTKASPPPD